MNCPECEKPLVEMVRKSKFKAKVLKHAINIKVRYCESCEEDFVEPKEQARYDAELKNFERRVKDLTVH